MVMTMKITVFWDAMVCSFVKIHWHFRGPQCLHWRGMFLYISATSTQFYGIKIQTTIIFRNY